MDKPASSETVLQHNRRYIPGGISSVNRAIDPAITFVKADGAYLWDSDGKRYIDYHAGFAPYFLGHNFRPVNDAAAAALFVFVVVECHGWVGVWVSYVGGHLCARWFPAVRTSCPRAFR